MTKEVIMKRNRSLSILRMMGILAVFVFSAGFLCATTIEVTEPGNLYTNLYNGTTFSIQWMQDGAVPTTGKVRISLRNEASTQEIKVIALDAPNTGTYSWMVPMNLVRNKYVVRIKLKGQNVYDDGKPFNVWAILRVTNPPTNGKLEETKTYTITWTWQGVVPNSKLLIRYMGNAGLTPIYSIADNVDAAGPCTWTVPGTIPKGNYTMLINIKNQPEWTYRSYFEIVLPKPHVPAEVKK